MNANSGWTEVSVSVDGEAAEAVAEYLQPFAYQQGVVLEQLGISADSRPDSLERDINVKIYFPAEEDTAELRERIREVLFYLAWLYPIPEPRFQKIADDDWSTKWKENFRPFSIGGRFWITPSWIEDIAPPKDSVVISMDPGMAFGTGLHPSTRMCLKAIDSCLRPGDSVLDVGTGSGILAIAAAKLGGSEIVAIDIDKVAVDAAQHNVKLNQVSEIVSVFNLELKNIKKRSWTLVVVNILAAVIKSLLMEGGLLGYLSDSGRLILSGIIDEQVDDVESTITNCGGVIEERLIEKDWVCLIISKSASAN